MKKLIALVLTIAMVFSMVVVAGAADFTDAADIDVKNTEAVSVLSALGVIAGMGDGKFSPDTILTREQAAKIICYLLVGDEVNNLPAAASTFKDVPTSRWSSKFVEYCASKGIVAGVGNGNFNPAGKLTGFAFAKMLLVAIGFNANEYGMVGAAWEKNTNDLLKEHNLNMGVTVASADLSRENACHLALNCMFYGEFENMEETLAYKTFGVFRSPGKAEFENLYRPTTVYTSMEEGQYWESVDMVVPASPFHVATGALTGGRIYTLVGNKEVSLEQVQVWRNGVGFVRDTSTDNIRQGASETFDRTAPGITTEMYYDATADQYTFVLYGFRAAQIVDAVAPIVVGNEVLEPGSVTLDNGMTIETNEFSPDDIGNYCMYNGVGQTTWNTLTLGTEVARGTIITGVLDSCGDATNVKIGGKTYLFNRFPCVTGADYVAAGGSEGDTVKGLVYNGIIYAVWGA